MPGHTELILIILVLVLLFGSRKLPELARSIGRSLSEFKRGKAEGEREQLEEKTGDDTESS
jgi:TatA/E family protein of Tat protein translocase